jgi:hypothetical protein
MQTWFHVCEGGRGKKGREREREREREEEEEEEEEDEDRRRNMTCKGALKIYWPNNEIPNL